MATKRVTTVTVDGQTYYSDDLYIIRKVASGGGEDTSRGQVGLRHVYMPYNDSPEAEVIRLRVLPALRKREARVNAAASARRMAEWDTDKRAEAIALVASVDAGAYGGYARLRVDRAAQAEWERRYNDIANEGGSGYIPYRPTQADYNRAKKLLGAA